ncbi:MAG: histidine kinase dimerization/phospho-acceptor domain-containing protein, partial [Thermoguttaceae bacterium]
MAYNSLKRIFGETKLELKLLFLFGVGLLVIIATAFWWYGSNTAKLVYDQNRSTAVLMLQEHVLATHLEDYKKLNRPAFIPPSPEEIQEERRWVDYNKSEFSTHPGKVEWIWSHLHPSASGPREQDEVEICNKFLIDSPKPPKSDEPKTTEYQELIDKREYRYFQPIRAKESCLTMCHAPPPGGSGLDPMGSAAVSLVGGASSPSAPALQPGNVMAIAKVTIPVAETQDKLNINSGILWTCAVVTVFLAMLTSYAIVRYVIVKPLRHLRDVSDAVTRGNIALRAEIHTGDEFEELSTAFNRMLRTLITIQEELRQANVNLDGKVDELAQVNMRLYEMNMLKSDFLATMSHELRTPLNSILGFSEVLAGIHVLDDKQKRYVQNIQKSGRTLLEMINDILDLAKMESGKMEIRLA